MPGKVLIVDGIASRRIVLRAKLTAAFFCVTQATNATDALQQITRDPPDLVLIDDPLPDMSGLAFCQRLKAQPTRWSGGIVLLQPSATRAALIAGLSSGADDVIFAPYSDPFLVARLRAMLRGKSHGFEGQIRHHLPSGAGFEAPNQAFLRPQTLTVLSCCAARAKQWQAALPLPAWEGGSSHSPDQIAQWHPGAKLPDLAVLDLVEGSAEQSLPALSALKARLDPNLPRLLAITGPGKPALAISALDQGADDVMQSGFDRDIATLRLQILARHKLRAEALQQRMQTELQAAVTDSLTGLHNRRFVLSQLRKLTDSPPAQQAIAVMLADIDQFKRINDRFGHSVGDKVLCAISRRLQATAEPGEVLGRVGGEEFLITARYPNSAQARARAQQFRRAIAARPFAIDRDHALPVTVSIGLALQPPQNKGGEPQTLLDQADKALYKAKAGGRNKVLLCRSAA